MSRYQFRVPLDNNKRDLSIQELYSEIVVNEMRNQLIVDNVVKSFELKGLPTSG